MKSKRVLALMATLLVGATSVSSFSGCGAKSDSIKEDPNKANLIVATYNGGVGYKWLEDAADRFEELYKDATHFQEGRTGVKIHVDPNKEKYGGGTLLDKSLLRDVYFTENVEYYSFINKGKVADITDIVSGENSSLAAYGEKGTIADKIDSNFAGYLTAGDGHYYMLPFYDGFYGFIYDIDLFESEGFFLDKDGDFTRLLFNGDETEAEIEQMRKEYDENKANGPDGVHGTYDDGLPATYEEMIALCDQILAKSCVPFCYSGAYNDYVSKAVRSFIADYEGYDGFSLNYTFDGKANLVKEIKDDWTVETEEVNITEKNAYELQRQAGKYYALKMQETLFGSTKYLGGTWNMFDFTVAQTEFINSKYTSTRYAMLVDGVWWENEAETTFKDIEALRGESKEDRRFGYLPMPKVSADKAGPQTMFSSNSSFGFINADCENMELAKEFMKFLHTDAEMSKFSAKTSISRALNYQVNEEDKKEATHFGRSLIEMRDASRVVYPYSALDVVIENPAFFHETKWYLTASIGGKTYNNPFTAFRDNKADAEKYFNGLYSYQKSVWSTLK